jgi:protein-tyrosine phosphatase
VPWSPDAAVNFRDIGGVTTSAGGLVRPGLIYRSASPQFLSDPDAARLVETTGIRLVIDLRYDAEAAAEGSGGLADLDGVRRHHVPIVGAGGDAITQAVRVGDDDDDLLGGYYASYLEHSAAAFVDVFRTLAAPDALPVLLHCAVGKDRTGTVIALLLGLLGVPDDAIVADYVRTAPNMPGLMALLAQSPTYGPTMLEPDEHDPLAQAHPGSMWAFLELLAARHGSAEQYLVDAGLEAQAIDALRGRMLEHAAA